ncbi:hypothetical protein V8B97DRAFT_1863685 [Scleroderma yunnanense]
MYIPRLPEVEQRSLLTEPSSLNQTRFILDTAAVAGILGGEEAISSITLVHVFEGWKWLGWYNSPGSYIMGMRFARLAQSAVPTLRDSTLHMQTDLAALFEYDCRRGPKFKAAHSGTIIHETGHLASLFMMECADLNATPIPGRNTQPVPVTIANLNHAPDAEVRAHWTEPCALIYACVPIVVSLGTCAASFIYGDWYSFSMILLGIIVSGISCLVIGSGTFLFIHPEPAPGSPPGDGILRGEEGVVILRGEERAVNAVTRGKFSLRFKDRDARRCIKYVKICSFLLVMQSIAQLILIPQSPLFGQLMFFLSLAVSWLYNLWLWSFNRDKVQRNILMNILGKPVLNRFVLGTRTTMVVFVLLVLDLNDPAPIMDDLLASSTKVWQKWKTVVINRLRNHERLMFDLHDWSDPEFSDDEKKMLETLFRDAENAYDGFQKHMDRIVGNL